MFLRKGEGNAGEGSDSSVSSSSSEDGDGGEEESLNTEDGPSENSSEPSSSSAGEEEQEDGGLTAEDETLLMRRLEDISESDVDEHAVSSDGLDSGEEEEEALLIEQIEKWYNDGLEKKKIGGRAITCVLCGGKKLILNSIMLCEHLQSKSHKRKLKHAGHDSNDTGENGEDLYEDLAKLLCFSDTFTQFMKATNEAENLETHRERMERIQTASKAEGKNESIENDQETCSKKYGKKSKGMRKKRPGKRQRLAMKLERS